MADRKKDKQPPKTKKYFRSTKKGAGMTTAGVARYRRENPGSKLKTAVTKKKNLSTKDKSRRKSYCARSAGQMKKFPKAAKDPNSRLRQARRRWRC
jgi:hypothetical protein|tara:strand:+ start:10013 stop:10300 length:288 start_codon:yes stop_codon:yes gene_type:complete